MPVRRFITAIAAMVAGASACLAEPPSREALDEYLQMSSSEVSTLATCLRFASELTPEDAAYCTEALEEEAPLSPGDASEYERNLLISLAELSAPEDIMARFAALSDRPESEAETIASLLIALAQEYETCDDRVFTDNCVPSDNTRIVDLILSAAAIDVDGSLLRQADRSLNLAVTLLSYADRLPSTPAIFRAFRDGYNYRQDFRYLVVSTYGGEIDPSILQSALTREPDSASDSDQLAYLDYLFDRLPSDERRTETGLLLTALQIRIALDLGLTDRALSQFAQLDEADRDQMWDRAIQSHLGASESLRSLQQIHKLMIDLAAASLRQADMRQARELLMRADQIAVFTEADERVAAEAASRQRYPSRRTRISLRHHARIALFLREFMSPTLSPSEAYNMFITGSVGPELVPNDDRRSRAASTGWLWSLRSGTPDAQELAAQYLESQDLPALASHARRLSQHSYSYPFPALELDAPGFASARNALAASIPKQSRDTNAGNSQARRLDVFTEAPLPEEHQRGNGQPVPAPSQPPADLSYPVEPWQIIRWERDGDDVRLIYQSTELDPAGEISGGGYWFAESEDGGASWRDPLYLGLQQYFPYVVLPMSSLPLVENDRLQIAVAVRELDPASITFPPVGLTALREEDGLYISAPLSDVRRDQDGDGLTDLYEHRIGLDMLNADSDGDGFPDGLDGLPLTAFDPDQLEETEIARIMLAQIIGQDANAIIMPLAQGSQSLEDMMQEMAIAAGAPTETRSTLILKGDPSLFSGLGSSSRIIVYDDEMIDRISPDYGVFYPVGFSATLPNHDRSQVYVIWSAGWVGGEFYIYRNAQGDYEVQVTSSWIT